MAIKSRYRFKVKQRPKKRDCWVQILEGNKIVRICKFTTCNAAMYWVEVAESYQT
jgi:hypothetical protein